MKLIAEKADVIVENYRSDVKASPESRLRHCGQAEPAIVYGSIGRLGQDGPEPHVPASTRSPGHGWADVDHRRARPGPMRVGIPIADLTRACCWPRP